MHGADVLCMSCAPGVACSGLILSHYFVAAALTAWMSLGSRLTLVFRICLDKECPSHTQSRLSA